MAHLADLHKRAELFLNKDLENPKRIMFAHGLAIASVGQEIDGTFYRLTDTYSKGWDSIWVPGLVAVEKVPDKAMRRERGEDFPDPTVGERLWRIRPSAIEDLAKTELLLSTSKDSHGRQEPYYLPSRNSVNRLEGKEFDHAVETIGRLLVLLEPRVPA